MKSLDEIKKLMALDKVSQAESALKEVLQREPDNLQAKMLYGLCRQLSGDEEAFKRIYNEVAPKMEQASQPEQPPETVSLWKKYRTLWKSLIVGGLVLAGTAVAVVYFGRTVNQQCASATLAVSGYRGPPRTELRKIPLDGTSSSVSNKRLETVNKRFKDENALP